MNAALAPSLYVVPPFLCVILEAYIYGKAFFSRGLIACFFEYVWDSTFGVSVPRDGARRVLVAECHEMYVMWFALWAVVCVLLSTVPGLGLWGFTHMIRSLFMIEHLQQ